MADPKEALERLKRDCETEGPTCSASDAWYAHVNDLRTLIAKQEGLEREVERLTNERDMLAFSASETACYLYPGEDQQPQRAAFAEGVSRAGVPLAAQTFDRLKASEAHWIGAATDNLTRAEAAEAKFSALQEACKPFAELWAAQPQDAAAMWSMAAEHFRAIYSALLPTVPVEGS